MMTRYSCNTSSSFIFRLSHICKIRRASSRAEEPRRPRGPRPSPVAYAWRSGKSYAEHEECAMNISIDTIIGTVIGMLTVGATLLAAILPAYLNRLSARSNQRYKLLYIQVCALSRRAERREPIYKRFIERLEKEIDVYDELHHYRLNIYNTPPSEFEITDRSSGVVDLNILHPWQSLQFPDEGARHVEQIIKQTIRSYSNMFFTRARYFNGFQPGNENVAMRMERDTEEARLVIDFSSLPHHEAIVAGWPKGTIRENNGNGTVTEGEIEVKRLRAGVYVVERLNLKKESVIRMDFKINWDVVDRVVDQQVRQQTSATAQL